MNILLSAFACRPNFGSEPGVGWNFTVELAKSHQVYVATRGENRKAIEQYEEYEKISKNVTFLYYDLPTWMGFKDTESSTAHLYYFLWQIGVFFQAKRWLLSYQIDLIHHITYGVFRIPSLLAFLGKPFIFGPLGGGEKYPFYLKKGLKKRHILIDLFRDLVNKLSIYNPLLRQTFKNSTLIACKNLETLKQIPSKYHERCIINTEIGLQEIPRISESQSQDSTQMELKLLYVGRLVYWKGLHLVLEAFALLLQKKPNYQLTIIGNGNDKQWFNKQAIKLNINHKITWIDRISQEHLFSIYQNYDLMVFPSLREAGGNVVIEAIAHQLPVICLDLGGPGEHITEKCGVIISTRNKNEQKIIREIAEVIQYINCNRGVLSQLKKTTQSRAKLFLLEKIVSQIYNHPLLQKHRESVY